jgi:steroid delta-isomerase-like uncharacterized protein
MTTSAGTRSPSAIALAMFDDLFGKHDLRDPYRYWTDESVDHFVATGESVRGAKQLAEWFRALLAAVPDWRVEVVEVFDDGDRQAVVQWRGHGTFEGAPFAGIEATGRSIEIRGVDVMRFDADGRIDVNTIYYDGAEFARQVGMLPPRDSARERLMLAAQNTSTRVKRRLRRPK